MLYRLCLALTLLLVTIVPVSAVTDIGSIRVDPTPAKSWEDLVKRSDLIVVAWADDSERSAPTGRTIRQGKLVNFVQNLHIRQFLKGSSSRLLPMVSTGVEPLPDASSPLNRAFPGPLTAGNYVLFLHSVSGTEFYSTVGLWQGVYPLFEGLTIALESAGFPELHHLSVEQLTKKIKSVTP